MVHIIKVKGYSLSGSENCYIFNNITELIKYLTIDGNNIELVAFYNEIENQLLIRGEGEIYIYLEPTTKDIELLIKELK